jgi:hypothetical protein
VSDAPKNNDERVVGAQALPDDDPKGASPPTEGLDALDTELTEDLLSEELEEPDDSIVVQPRWLGEMPYWALSAILHIVLLLVIVNVIVSRRTEEPERQPLKVASKKPPDPYDPKQKRGLVKKLKIPQPILPEIPVVKRKIEEIAVEIPKGTDLDRQSDFNLDARFFNVDIGLGGGAAGAYGERWGKGSLSREGGSEATESAVRAALEWLVRHQASNGSWEGKGFTSRCKEPSCRNKGDGKAGGASNDSYNVGVTGLAVLAFTGAGNSHRSATDPRFAKALRRAMQYLLGQQQAGASGDFDGKIGPGNAHHSAYNHAIAAMALGELLVLSRDRLKLQRPVAAATDYCLRARTPSRAWRYRFRDGSNDTSVTGWMILALKTGKLSKLGIDADRYRSAFEDSITYFESLTNEAGRAGYTKRGHENHSVPTMTSVSVLCRLFAGENRRVKAIRGGVDQLLASQPAWRDNGSGVDFYYWYYATYAAFQVGGSAWKKWNPPMKKALIASQRRGGCEDGSWDPIGTWAKSAGRVYSTAMGAMTLEVYYRFARTKAGLGFLNE